MTRVVVHISTVDDALLSGSDRVLDAAEREQARRFLRSADGRLFSAGRVQRRLVLGRYLGIDPSRLEFTLTDLGKPLLAGPNKDALNFNTSQSSGFVAIAVALERRVDVGVDIENVNRRVTETLARSCLTKTEQMWLDSLPHHYRDDGFIRLWTCKEAILKASGHGLRIDPRSIELDPQRLSILHLPNDLGSPARYRLQADTVGEAIRIAACIITSSEDLLELEVHSDDPRKEHRH